ncbi:sensor domain-containing diguanylate cyclase [Emcibacter nanhaiensis]|uniref:Diguanylate cyclase n=1 Tax=Emcibacter nanhaiensis TaxID=1505037 RepID=A0A501PNN4_9PROT|nr:sensor domain-containing diguanylate cyclase [Emcibacter nanhaiensis]TPD61778.1 diguanylate cyclase [Emcibacter nanhaiensis]
MTYEKNTTNIYPLLGILMFFLLLAGMVFSDGNIAGVFAVFGITLAVFMVFYLYRKNVSLEEKLEETSLELHASRDALAAEKSALQKIAEENIGLAEENFLAREEAEAHSSLLMAVMENMPQAVCLVSADGEMLNWNSKMAPLFGLAPEAISADMTFAQLSWSLSDARLSVPDHALVGKYNLSDDLPETAVPDEVTHYEREMEDGRTLEVFRTVLLDGSFVATYTDITERKKAEHVIRRMAHFDGVTGLSNRAHFTEKLEGRLHQSRRNDGPFAVVMLDLDKFKHVNDTHGHPMGDALLERVAEIFAVSVRDDDLVARFGGDEFAIMFDEINEIEEVLAPLNRILKKISQPLEIDGVELEVGTSMGVAMFPDHGTTADGLIKTADEALYLAKKNGRGRIEVAGLPPKGLKLLV